jgi:hypothetical protein
MSTTVTYHFKVNTSEIATDQHVLTGRQIKALATGVEATDLLELRKGDQRIPIGDDTPVQVENGLHFVTYPAGSDS